MSAEDLGKRLLAEVEEVGFDEIINALKLHSESDRSYFDLPQLDSFLQTMIEAQSSTSKVSGTVPMVEITSQRPGSGKTHLLYHLAAKATLPFHLGGREAAVVFIDTDNHFSATRLAQQMRKLIITHTEEKFLDETSIDQTLLDNLKHIHVLRPQSLPATIATLKSLPTYLFNPTQHHSSDRAIGLIALDSASAFYWQSRSDLEDSALHTSLESTKQQQQPPGYIQLAAAAKNASRVLSAPILYTTRDFNPPSKATHPILGPDPRLIRPSLPPPWPNLPTLKLVVRRAPIRSLPAECTVEDAIRETEMRSKVVQQGKFECFVNEWGIDERTIQKLRTKGDMFEFFITDSGIKIGDGPE